MTLAWGLLFKLMPRERPRRDRRAGDDDQGLRPAVGVPLTGLAIDLLKPHLSATQGFQALWPLLGVPILAVIPLVMTLEKIESRPTASPSATPTRRCRGVRA